MIVFDIGGTHTRIAKATHNPAGAPLLSHKQEFNTPEDFEEGVDLLIRTISKCGENDTSTDPIAGGFPGKINATSVITYAPHLPKWVGKSLTEEFRNKLGVVPSMANDAALAALGEAHFGAGKGGKIVAYLTLSTGIGGARIVNGAIDSSTDGFEPGHHIIDWQTLETYENLASGFGLQNKFRIEPKAISQEIYDEISKIVAVGLSNITSLWSPDIIVLGGPMILKKPGYNLEIVKKYFLEIVRLPYPPEIKLASLGGDSGLVGASLLGKSGNNL